jgi:ATP-dependent Clp protease ATP-binding subunit ClpC
MNPLRRRSVFRYLQPADQFVRIDVREPSDGAVRVRAGLNRTAYRRLVIDACCSELSGDAAGWLVERCPDDPLTAEDLLYQLCVEVNPHLDIHTVRLAAEGEEEGTAPAAARARAPQDGGKALRASARDIERRLAARVIGQGEAVRCVARAVRKAAAGLTQPNRPLAALLLVGRTGTGKTELARALARELYPDSPGGRLVRVDCTEYALAHEYAKLIGAPPGYVGHEQGGFLTEALRKTPECVVLFDEVEKAHPRLHHLLLQVLDEGHLSDGRGRRTDFGRAFVVLTSNAGAVEMQSATRKVGFGRARALGEPALREIATSALEAQFAPEFLARLDERIVFRELDSDDARRIAARLLSEVSQRARSQRIAVAIAPSVAAWVARRGFSPDSGARELRRVVEREIEAPIADLLIAGEGRGARKRLRPGALVRVTIRGGRPRFAVEA